MSKPPKWVRRYARRCVRALGLQDTTIRLRWRQTVGDDVDTNGEAASRPRYREATITLRSDLRPTAYGYEVIYHEYLHVALMRQREAAERLIGLVPAELQDHARTLWVDANEATVTRLARVLSQPLRKGRK